MTTPITPIEAIVLIALDGSKDPTGRGLVLRLDDLGFKTSSTYKCLYGLEQRKLLRSSVGESSPRRGGRSPICYSLTARGKRAMIAWVAAFNVLRTKR